MYQQTTSLKAKQFKLNVYNDDDDDDVFLFNMYKLVLKYMYASLNNLRCYFCFILLEKF